MTLLLCSLHAREQFGSGLLQPSEVRVGYWPEPALARIHHVQSLHPKESIIFYLLEVDQQEQIDPLVFFLLFYFEVEGIEDIESMLMTR